MLFKKRVFNQIIRSVPNIKYDNDIDGYASYGDNFYDFFPCRVNDETKKYESDIMVAKKLTKSKATEKQIFTDSEYVVKRISQTHSKKNWRMLD